MENILEINNLTVDIDNGGGRIVQAVKGLTISVPEGKTLGIAGESGSGKSVTALCVCGLQRENMKIKSGTVVFQGKDILADSRYAKEVRGKEISVIFQDHLTSFNPLMKIGRQVEESARIHTKKTGAEIRQMAKKAMEYAELKDIDRLYNAYPHQLSGGMRQRAMIAASIILRPKLLIADEATTSLDVAVQNQIIELFCKLKRESSMSILFISHNLSLIQRLCDYIAVMYKGVLMEYGSCGEIIENPAHPYTEALINSIPTPESKGRSLYRIKEGLEPSHGCPFAPRCHKAGPRCFRETPPIKESGRRAACFGANNGKITAGA